MCFCMTANYCCVSSDANSISKELETMEKGIPLPYHHVLIERVNQYEKKALPELFTSLDTLFEKELQKRGIPLELKYLPISLTEMNPNFQKGDRCGLWALPTLVGLHYGLIINESQDERFSVEASTRAALDYLSDLYQKYNDWWYSILAFSNSPNSVQHAISHCNTQPQLWDFYDQKLIPDTKVISDLIACVYVYHDNEPTTLTHVASTNVKKAIIKETPKTTIEENQAQTNQQLEEQNENIEKHMVKKGETLSHIAQKHHVDVKSLMEWNHLESDLILDGQELIIKK